LGRRRRDQTTATETVELCGSHPHRYHLLGPRFCKAYRTSILSVSKKSLRRSLAHHAMPNGPSTDVDNLEDVEIGAGFGCIDGRSFRILTFNTLASYVVLLWTIGFWCRGETSMAVTFIPLGTCVQRTRVLFAKSPPVLRHFSHHSVWMIPSCMRQSYRRCQI
jgi:hypothetical protein